MRVLYFIWDCGYQIYSLVCSLFFDDYNCC